MSALEVSALMSELTVLCSRLVALYFTNSLSAEENSWTHFCFYTVVTKASLELHRRKTVFNMQSA